MSEFLDPGVLNALLQVVLIDLVLCPAFDRFADESLTMHMLQHVVLMAIVPPLVVVSVPPTIAALSTDTVEPVPLAAIEPLPV